MSFISIIKLTIHAYVSPFRSPYANISEAIAQLCLTLLASLKIASNMYYTSVAGEKIVTNLIILIPFVWVAVTLSWKSLIRCKRPPPPAEELPDLPEFIDTNIRSDDSKTPINMEEIRLLDTSPPRYE